MTDCQDTKSPGHRSEVSKHTRMRLAIRGAVQGVGFRPFVHRLAHDCHLNGWIQNNTSGVLVEVEGDRDTLAVFAHRLHHEMPPRASIHGVESRYLPCRGYTDFQIHPSDQHGHKSAVVLPDIATCADCLAEMNDPDDRRYRYPFTNCTNCGPRFSIIEALPYDRSTTTMRGFHMCASCRHEYDDPANRRFHAQPNACPECGPFLEYWDTTGSVLRKQGSALMAAAEDIRRGWVVAVKGLGGFHLIVDARNHAAVETLRRRKHREEKPFALMYPNLESAGRDCDVSAEEIVLLQSPEAPIVLLDRHERVSICDNVTGPTPTLGVMLPYTPVHHLLMADLGFPVVATSGNIADEPICTDGQDALKRLHGIADSFLVHNRPIAHHADDSIVRVVAGRPMLLRRARGYAPFPVSLGESPRNDSVILAVGAHLKNTLAISGEAGISITQHIGDLDTAGADAAFVRVAGDLTKLLDSKPGLIACDLHPDYHSTVWAKCQGLPTTAIQHHHAHVVAGMIDNDLDAEVLGVAWDGTGYGADGTIWGGEFLRCSRTDFTRIACLRSFSLPGGDAAVKEPRRSALGLLLEIGDDDALADADLATVQAFSKTERDILRRMVTRKINSPVTSSAGRLFDAVSSILGLRQVARFEGQAAMLLEHAAMQVSTYARYAYSIREDRENDGLRIVDWEPMIVRILADRKRGETTAAIAAKFHNTLASMIAAVARRHAHETGETRVVLSGGCFQNRLLLETCVSILADDGLTPFWHQWIPPNDGGISAGQAAVGRARLNAGSE